MQSYFHSFLFALVFCLLNKLKMYSHYLIVLFDHLLLCQFQFLIHILIYSSRVSYFFDNLVLDRSLISTITHDLSALLLNIIKRCWMNSLKSLYFIIAASIFPNYSIICVLELGLRIFLLCPESKTIICSKIIIRVAIVAAVFNHTLRSLSSLKL